MERNIITIDDRVDIDTYLMLIAWAAKMRSTCPRMACGAVVSQNGLVISTGYNGAPPDEPHCVDVGCLMAVERERERCQRIIHAEVNAVQRACGRGNWLHTTGQPCFNCLKFISNSRHIERVVWYHPYPDRYRDQFLERSPGIQRIKIEQIKMPAGLEAAERLIRG
jgi:dCMP deaminase